MEPGFQVDSRAGTRPSQRVIRLTGRLGLDTVPEFLKSVRAASEPVVILDLGGLSYIDSAGVGSLVQTFASFRKADRRLALTDVSDRIRAVLEITRVHAVLPHFPTVSDAERQLP